LVRRFSGACVRERLFSKYLPYSFSWIIVEELLNAACLFGIWPFSLTNCLQLLALVSLMSRGRPGFNSPPGRFNFVQKTKDFFSKLLLEDSTKKAYKYQRLLTLATLQYTLVRG
jgi:integral membrane sensor domain MASE1